MSNVLLNQRTSFSADLSSESLTVSCYPDGNLMRGITALFDAPDPSNIEQDGCFVVGKVWDLLTSSPKYRELSVLLFLSGSIVQVFLSEKLTTPSAGADLRSFTSLWSPTKRLVRLVCLISGLFKITRDLPHNLATTRNTFLTPISNPLAC